MLYGRNGFMNGIEASWVGIVGETKLGIYVWLDMGEITVLQSMEMWLTLPQIAQTFLGEYIFCDGPIPLNIYNMQNLDGNLVICKL